MIDVRHAGALRVLLDRILGLLLRADEEHGAAAACEVARERGSLLEELEGLLQVDDVDAPALAEDEAAHLRVPAAGLVAEVDTGLQQLSHGNDGQAFLLWLFALQPAAFGWNRSPFRSGTATRPSRRDELQSR